MNTPSLSQKIEEIRSKIAGIRHEIFELHSTDKLFADQLTPVEGLLTCGLSTLYSVRKEVMKWEIQRDEQLHGKSYSFASRGTGLDTCPGCFVCGTTLRAEGANWYMNNIAGFVETKEEGELIASWFKQGARLDYRPDYPDRIQLKIGSCDAHLPNLKLLSKRTDDNNCRIREHDVTVAQELIAEVAV